ncbi:MAG: hypothetical protein PHV34_05630 [Verrucomicrobiae bacterium]|nr:hypothetical protein [Verrucomicrobiae bacterium]
MFALAADVMAIDESKCLFRFKVDEGRGEILQDVSDNRLKAALEGNFEWVDAARGRVLVFDGVTCSGKIEATPNVNANIQDRFAVTVWIKAAAEQKCAYPKLLSIKDVFALHITRNPPFTVCANLRIKGQLFQVASGDLKPGEWHHLAFVYNGAEARIHVDGKMRETRKCGGKMSLSNAPVMIGAESPSHGFFCGQMGEIALSNDALTGGEILREYETQAERYFSAGGKKRETIQPDGGKDKPGKTTVSREILENPLRWGCEEISSGENRGIQLATDSLLPGETYRIRFRYSGQSLGDKAAIGLKMHFKDAEGGAVARAETRQLKCGKAVEWTETMEIPSEAARTLMEIMPADAALVCENLVFEHLPPSGKWQAKWMVYPEDRESENISRFFRKTFSMPDVPSSAWMLIAADDAYELYLNGSLVGKGSGWCYPETYHVARHLRPGRNVAAVKVLNYAGPYGVLCELHANRQKENLARVFGDESWKCSAREEKGWETPGFNDGQWKAAGVRGYVPAKPWGDVPYVDFQGKDEGGGKNVPLNRIFKEISGEKTMVAEIKGGEIPALVLNGEKKFPMLGRDTHLKGKYVREYGDNGIHLYITSCVRVGLSENSTRDYSEIDAIANSTLAYDPKARLILVVDLTPPEWWLKKNPEERCKFDDGAMGMQSLSSRKWMKEAGDALECLMDHVGKSPYGKRIAGYFPSSGYTGEWQSWGCQEGRMGDGSGPAIDAFRRWLREKYENDEARLQKAWGRQGVSFDGVSMPAKEEYQRQDFGVFRDPCRSRNVIDYLQWKADVVAGDILHFSQVVKNKSNRRMLCGAFYGYIFEHAGMGGALVHGGHLAMEKILKSKDVDFIAAPVSYRLRKKGGAGAYMLPKDSVRLHGKMLFHEADMRTYLSAANAGHGRLENLRDTIGVLKREFAKMPVDRIGLWWFDMKGGWFSNQAIGRMFSKASRIGSKSLGKSRPFHSEIAVIIDETSPFFVNPSGQALNNEAISMQREALHEMGAPFDSYLLSDVFDRDFPDYKMYVFLNAFYLSEKQRKDLGARLKKDGHLLLWIYAPGLAGENGIGVANCGGVLDFNLGCENKPAPLSVRLAPGVFDGRCKTECYGMTTPAGPVCHIDDPGVTALGSLANGKCGLGFKKSGGWISAYSAAPRLPADVLREFARMAGVHLYVESPDVIFANHDYFGMHVAETGEKAVRLPCKASPCELFTEKTFGKDCREFRFFGEKGETFLFELNHEDDNHAH